MANMLTALAETFHLASLSRLSWDYAY